VFLFNIFYDFSLLDRLLCVSWTRYLALTFTNRHCKKTKTGASPRKPSPPTLERATDYWSGPLLVETKGRGSPYDFTLTILVVDRESLEHRFFWWPQMPPSSLNLGLTLLSSRDTPSFRLVEAIWARQQKSSVRVPPYLLLATQFRQTLLRGKMCEITDPRYLDFRGRPKNRRASGLGAITSAKQKEKLSLKAIRCTPMGAFTVLWWGKEKPPKARAAPNA